MPARAGDFNWRHGGLVLALIVGYWGERACIGALQPIKYLTAALVLVLLGHGSMSTGGRLGRPAASRASANAGIVSRGGAT